MQLDAPEVLYSKPANAFVADFVGFENMIEMTVVEETGDAVRAELAGGARLDLPKERFSVPGRRFLFATRPDGLLVAREGEGIPARLSLRTYLGRAYQYRCHTPAGEIVANGPLSDPLEPGAEVVLVPQPDQCCVLPAETA
jgi:putative spermidine/putrescine transport system ATP-binding protein